MKYLITFTALVLSSFILQAQHLIESDEYKIAFETSELLENYKTESNTVLGYENDNYAVDIEILTVEQVAKKHIADQQLGANALAKGLGFKNTIDGGRIPYIKTAYYVLTKDKDQGKLIPVYVLFMVNTDLNLVYEITVYCYNNNGEEGERITKSFRFLETSNSGGDD